MAMSVSAGTSSVGRSPVHGSFEKVTVAWTADSGGIASDTISLTGALVEAVTTVGTAKIHRIELRDVDDSDVDYAAGSLATCDSDVEYHEPIVVSDRAPVLAGEVVFHVSDKAATADATGTAYLFLRT